MDWEELKGRVARAIFNRTGYLTPSRFNTRPAQPGEEERWCWKEIGLAVHTVGPAKMIGVLEEVFADDPVNRAKMAEMVPRIMAQTPKTLAEIKQHWRDRSVETGDREDPLVAIERGLMMATWAGAREVARPELPEAAGGP